MNSPASPPSLVVVVFSKDRPLQVDGALRSWKRHCRDVGPVSVKVLYKASTARLLSLYQLLMREHPEVDFVQEGNFRQDLLRLLRGPDYVLFVVDDTVFVRDFTAADIAGLLQRHPEVVGFSMRLGRNTSYCYSMDHAQKLPDFAPLENGALKYRWPGADYDFAYPLEVSSSVYRCKEMLPLLEQLEFKTPNTLEDVFSRSAGRFRESHPFLACWEQSRAFSIPANKVQQFWDNRTSGNAAYSAETLAALFAQGQRIQTQFFDGFIPEACHQEIEFKTAREAEPLPPLVTVVIPCYKQAQFLPEAVASVVGQTFLDWELIIVNDGSPDDTSAVARELIKQHPEKRIRLLEKTNGGLADARNAGIAAGSGEYFLPLDADDKIAPTFLSKAVAVLDSQAKVGFVYSHIQHFGMQDDLYPLPDFDADTIVHKDNVACVCSLVRRKAYEQLGGYNVKMREEKEGYEDWDFWVGCIAAGWQGRRIPEPLFFYRKRQDSMLASTPEKRQRLIARIVLNHPGLYSAERIRRAKLELEGNSVAAKPTRILLVCTHFWPSVGGLETIIENLGVRLVQRGLEVAVATLALKDRYFNTHRGMEIINLDPGQVNDKKGPPFHPRVRELVASDEYAACVFFSNPQNWVMWSLDGLTVPPSTRLIAQPIINADGYAQWKDNQEFRERLKSLLSRFHTITALSTDGNEVKFLREAGLPYVYLPNAAEAGSGEGAAAFRQRFKIPEGKPMLLHVANLWRVKNHLGLMQSLSYLPGDWQLVMIGHPSEEKDCSQEVRAAAARDPRFLLIPGLPHEEVIAAMAAADVVLLPSLGEVSPVCILEAMSQGRPWVATPECGAVFDNAGGLIVPLAQFPETLQKLITHPSHAQRLGRLGWEHWQACFSWERVAAGWEQVILTGKTSDNFEMPAALRKAMTEIKAELDGVVANCKQLRAFPIPVGKVQQAPSGPAPLVTVVIPCYKQAQYLPEAVASVVAQTFADWEIIIVNDGSPDDTSAVARELMKKYAGRRIRLLEKKNGGLAQARNAGIRAAGGTYILPLDADDKIEPAFLEKTVALLEAEPGVAIVYTDVGHFGAAEKTIQAAEFDFKKLCVNNQLNYCSLFRRDAWKSAGGYNSNMVWGYEDWDFWIGCGELGLVARRIPGALLQYRVKDSSMYTDALAHDADLRARIVLNHPALYDAKKLAEARAIWSNPALPRPPGAPKVSVIVPTFNRPERLEETLRSIAGQTLQDFEIIVVNDNGLDVEHIIARCNTGVEIIYLRHNANRGLAAARNTGLRHASGRYIAFLDDDDIFLPDHLQTLVSFLESSGKQAAYTDAWCVEEEKTADGNYLITRRHVPFSEDWDNDRILISNIAPVQCFLFERSIAIKAGELDEQLTTHEDWEYWIRISRLCTPVHIRKVTSEFRVRKDGSSMTSSRRADFLRTARIIYKRHERHTAFKKSIRFKQELFLRALEAEVGAPQEKIFSHKFLVWLRGIMGHHDKFAP